jgi:hypothetical protein
LNSFEISGRKKPFEAAAITTTATPERGATTATTTPVTTATRKTARSQAAT